MDDPISTTASTDLALLTQQLTRLGRLIAEHHEQVGRTGLATNSQQLVDGLVPADHLLRRLQRKLDAQQQEQQRLHALREVSALVNSSLDIDEVLKSVMDSIITLTGAERAFLMLKEGPEDALVVRAARNVDRESIASSEFSFSRSVVQRVADTGEALLTTDAQDDPRFSGQRSVISFNLRSILCVPLKTKEQTTGAIYVDNRVASGIFHEEDRELLAAFAHQAAIALENAHLFRQTRDQLASITEMKRLMDDVFASIPSGVITLDAHGHISLVNPAAERILGVGAAATGQPYRQALAPIAGELAPLVDGALTDGGIHALEFDALLPAREGKTTLYLTCAPLEGREGAQQGAALVVDDVSQKKRLDSVRRYLPPALVDHIVDLDAAQTPERRRVTTLFADMRNFSAISEKLEPESLVQMVNGYFTLAAEAISAQEGVIDKFMGDAVMATFNTSLNPQEDDHIERAVRAALHFRDAVAAYHSHEPDERQLYFGLGIHVGDAVVGNVGSQFRKDYSAMGDAVNLAKRLQEMAAPDQVLITQEVYDAVAAWTDTRLVGEVRIKGRQAAVTVYELVGAKA